MRSEWAYYESLLSPEECDAIAAEALSRTPSRGTVSGDNVVDTSIRDSEVAFISRTDPAFAHVFATLDYCVDEANDQWFGVRYNRFGARSLQFTVYRGDVANERGGQFYDAHQDCSLISGESPTQRKLSVVAQLSDPDAYEGGEFETLHVSSHPPADAIRKRGTVLVFPSIVMHRVTPVTKGTRYSLVGWYSGPPWQ